MELVVLGLGSNRSFKKPDGFELTPIQILKNSCEKLRDFLHEFKISSFYGSKPMDYTAQEDFTNAVACGFFSGTPFELLKRTQEIEAAFGRNRKTEIPKGPRTLDIDIELFGNRIICEKNLRIPHESLLLRPFVVFPLLEILPNSADPLSNTSFAQIAKNLNKGTIWKIR